MRFASFAENLFSRAVCDSAIIQALNYPVTAKANLSRWNAVPSGKSAGLSACVPPQKQSELEQWGWFGRATASIYPHSQTELQSVRELGGLKIRLLRWTFRCAELSRPGTVWQRITRYRVALWRCGALALSTGARTCHCRDLALLGRRLPAIVWPCGALALWRSGGVTKWQRHQRGRCATPCCRTDRASLQLTETGLSSLPNGASKRPGIQVPSAALWVGFSGCQRLVTVCRASPLPLSPL
jgi:hypothetical protein